MGQCLNEAGVGGETLGPAALLTLEKILNPAIFAFPFSGYIHFPSPSLTVQSGVPPGFVFCIVI